MLIEFTTGPQNPDFRHALAQVIGYGSDLWQLSLDDEATDAVLEHLAEVLQSGDFTFVIAAQRFTETMRASLDYLNSTMRVGRFFLVEIVQLAGAELTAHAAQVAAAPSRRTQTTASGGSRVTTDEAAFLSSLDGDEYRDAFRDFLAACSALGLVLAWGSKGLSIRIPTPDRNEPLSIAWGLPDGA